MIFYKHKMCCIFGLKTPRFYCIFIFHHFFSLWQRSKTFPENLLIFFDSTLNMFQKLSSEFKFGNMNRKFWMKIIFWEVCLIFHFHIICRYVNLLPRGPPNFQCSKKWQYWFQINDPTSFLMTWKLSKDGMFTNLF